MRLSTSVYFLIFLVLLVVADKAKIRKLTESNLEQFSKDNSYWLIQIAQGRCAQCISQEAELEQVAVMLDGAIKVGKIDAKLIPTLKIQKSPTYIFTRSDHPENSIPFKGKFSKKDITQFCLEGLNSNFKERESKSEGSGKESSGSTRSRSSSGASSSQSSGSTTSVIELTDQVFQSKVLNSDDAWLVQFYSPGCGHCRSFEPEYAKLPKLIGKRVHISRIDGSKNQQFMGRYQVKGFPTVLLFDTENKDEPIPYNGQRTAEDVAEWLKGQNINEEKREIMELTKSNYIRECNRNIICLFFILDSKSDRQKLTWLQDTLVEQAEKPFRFFFSERLEQFESELLINDRTAPIMVSVWDSLNSYRIYNGGLTHDDLNTYLKTVLQRRGWIRGQRKIVDSIFSSGSQL